MNLPSAAAIALIEEPASAGKGVLSSGTPLSAAAAGGPFSDTFARAFESQASAPEADPASDEPGPAGGRQDLAAGGNPLPAGPDESMPALRLMEPGTLDSVVTDRPVGEQQPTSEGLPPQPGSENEAPRTPAATSAAAGADLQAAIAGLVDAHAQPRAASAETRASLQAPPPLEVHTGMATANPLAPAPPGGEQEASAALPGAPHPAPSAGRAPGLEAAPVTPSREMPAGSSQAAAGSEAPAAPAASAPTPATSATEALAASALPAATGVTTPSEEMPATPLPVPPAGSPQAAAAVAPTASPVSAAIGPPAASAAADPRRLDLPRQGVMPPSGMPDEARGQLPAGQGSAPLSGHRLAAAHAALAASPVPAAVTAETASPAHGAADRALADGAPELAVSAARALSAANAMAEPFEGRARPATSFDDGDRAGGLPAFARSSMQPPSVEPLAPLPSAARSGLTLPPGLQQPGWNQALGERVLWLVSHDVQRAELTLNPPELGALRVRVTLAGQAASVAFASEHAPVREAVEAALPQLRQILAERGLSLDHVHVSAQESGQRWTQRGSDSPPERQWQWPGNGTDSVHETSAARISLHRGLIDQYA